MSNQRLKLHEKLVDVLGSDHVYFQPPEGMRLQYPCIIYERRSKSIAYADDLNYIKVPVYDVTVIDLNPDSEIPERLEEAFNCRFDRHFTSDNLNHDLYVVSIT